MKKISLSLILVSVLIFSSCKKSVRKNCECITIYSGSAVPDPKTTAFNNDTTFFNIQDGDCSGSDASTEITYFEDTTLHIPETKLNTKITCTEK